MPTCCTYNRNKGKEPAHTHTRQLRKYRRACVWGNTEGDSSFTVCMGNRDVLAVGSCLMQKHGARENPEWFAHCLATRVGNCRAGDLTWVNLQAHSPRRAQFSFKLLHLCSPKGFGNRALGLESLVQEPLRAAAMQSTGKRVGKRALSCWICCTKINGQYVPVYRQPAHRQQCSEDHNGNHRAFLGYGALTLGDSLDFFKTDLILKIHQQQASFDILFSCQLHTRVLQSHLQQGHLRAVTPLTFS